MRFLAAAATVLAVASCANAQNDPLEKVRPAPQLSFIVPGHGPETLAQFKGKVVALEFISTTCPHCKAASHLMSKLQNEYGARGVQVIDVATNPNADLLVEDFAKEQATTFPVGWTTPDQLTAFMGWSPTERSVVPQLVLIDRHGQIHYQTPPLSGPDSNWDKYMEETAIRKHIEHLLALK